MENMALYGAGGGKEGPGGVESHEIAIRIAESM